MYLVDTSIISALAPTKSGDAGPLYNWLDRASERLFLSVITASEVEAGIAKAERLGATTKAHRLRQWWDAIEHLYADRILPIDLTIAATVGRLIDASRAHDPGYEDLAIAATAKCHGLTVLTRNLRHFTPLDVPAIDPFEHLPGLDLL